MATTAATTTSRSRPARALRRGGGLLLALTLAGCTYTVRLVSDPVGATLTLPDGGVAATPHTATFRWRPHQPLHIEAPGYRPLDVDLKRTEGRLLRYWGGALFQRGGREVTFLLVPLHGPIGSAEAE